MKTLKFFVGGLAGLLMVTILNGCAGTGALGLNTQLARPTLLFFNASPASYSYDFFLNDDEEATALGYLEQTTDFQSVAFLSADQGGYDVSIRQNGTTEELERDYRLFQRGTHTIVMAYGKQDFNDEPNKRLQHLFATIDRTTPIGNKARLIIVNALIREEGIENTAINFQSYDPSDPASEDNPQFQRSNIGYGVFDQGSQTLLIDSGEQSFQARESGSDAVVIYASKTFTFEPGKIYLALVSGESGSLDPSLQPKISFIELSTKD